MLSLPCTAYDRILLCLFLVFLTLFWAFLSFQIHPKPYTLWTIGVVSATVRDDVVDKMVADALDKLALELQDDTDNYTYDFDVRVAKADCKGSDLSKADDDYVVIGIALTCGRTAVKY